ncbi:aminoglycoside phosphotransferase family protein [Kineosporia sp. NBRC 101731]|uniref:aminoglycoside phosphotransferase family protein n=1 Tax=Kineosporia sp. NBRC 101731 TaxID=3032199 RepID=UPI0024A098EB|nr:aminoglycoside phosphotransferase family protein [Kineosporia sp. NBRC 101731]GLY28738.1 aminoglycoside phosphotransferase [Kineosporia sp. NBRC 101731]
MSRTPPSDVEITADTVRRLLREQHPDLAPEPVTVLANGWDNVIARVGDDLLARLPRREKAAQLVLAEQAWLPTLAPRLPLSVPVPVRTGVPTSFYPYAWSLTPWLPGRPVVSGDGGTAEIDPLGTALALGEFLGALHHPAPPHAPTHLTRGVPLLDRRVLDDRNAALVADGAHLVEALETGRDVKPWPHEPLWLHGDLHPANILVHEGQIGAVIDFGDITAGDPATDLAVAWMLVPAHTRDAFWGQYAQAVPFLDENLVVRARAWAAAFALVFLANSADNPQMAAIGRATSRALRAE